MLVERLDRKSLFCSSYDIYQTQGVVDFVFQNIGLEDESLMGPNRHCIKLDYHLTCNGTAKENLMSLSYGYSISRNMMMCLASPHFNIVRKPFSSDWQCQFLVSQLSHFRIAERPRLQPQAASSASIEARKLVKIVLSWTAYGKKSI